MIKGSFEDEVKVLVAKKNNSNGNHQISYIKKLKNDVAVEQGRFKNNQKLANMFLGYVSLCLLAWYSNWVPVLFGVGHVETTDRAISFNSLGHSSGVFLCAFASFLSCVDSLYLPTSLPLTKVVSSLLPSFIFIKSY